MSEINCLIWKYTSGSDIGLPYKQFLQLVLPYNAYLRFSSVQKLSCEKTLDSYIESKLARLITKNIEINDALEQKKIVLKNILGFNPCMIFNIIDKHKENSINEKNVRNFLLERGYEDVSELFIRGLDMDMDGKLSYDEFLHGIISYYTMFQKIANDSDQEGDKIKSFETPESQKNFMHNDTAEVIKKVEKSSPNYSSESTYASPYRPETNKKQLSLSVADPCYTNYFEEKLPGKFNITKIVLISIIKDYLSIEKKLENCKVDLALRSDFNLLDAFRIFDTSKNCYITIIDFVNGLNNLGINKSDVYIGALFRKYTKNCTQMKYPEFCDMIISKDINYSGIVSNRNSSSVCKEFSYDTQILFKTLLSESIDGEYEKEEIRQNLRLNSDFDAYDAFKHIDIKQKGYLSLFDVIIIINQ